MDDGVIDRVLDERRGIRNAPQAREIGLVFGEEQLIRALAVEPVCAQFFMRRLDFLRRTRAQIWLAIVAAPAPRVAKPDRSEEHTSELQSRFGISYAVFCL